MQGKKKLTLLAAACALMLSACNFTGSSSTPAPATGETGTEANTETAATSPQVLNLVETSDISSLDVMTAHDSYSNNVLSNAMEGLYGLDKQGQPVLTGASEHKVSEDGLTHTFTIRDSVWSNGDPVKASDYEFAWKRTFRETGYYCYMFSNAKILNADRIAKGEATPDELGVKAEDDKTLVVTLSAPSPLLPSYLMFTPFFPVNEKLVTELGDKYGLEANQVVYNGPFVVEEWKHEQGWKLTKNDQYWDKDAVQIEEINVFVVKEESTAVNLFDTGKVDRIKISSAYVDQYKNDPAYSIENRGGLGFLRFNHGHEVLSNKNIRKAIDLAIDKQGLADIVINNGSSPTYFLVPKSASPSPGGKNFREINGDFTGTAEDAKAAFQQGLSEIGASTVSLNILAADTTESKSIAEYLKNQLETNLEGLEIKISVQPLQRRLELEKAIDYDISISTYVPLNSDPISYLEMFETDGNFNRMGYSNPRYDELVTQAKAELDMEKRYDLMLEAEKILFEDAAIAPLYQSADSIVQKPYVKDFVSYPAMPQHGYKWVKIEGK